MTSIQVSGLRDAVEIIKLSSAEILQENKIAAKIDIDEYRTDSIDIGSILPTLQITFSGVVAVVQIINLVLSLQEKRSKATSQKNTLISIDIEASNGKKLCFKISEGLTDTEIKKYLRNVQDFVSDFLEGNDGISLKKAEEKNTLSLSDIVIINLLFRKLKDKLINIKEMKSSPPIYNGNLITFDSPFANISPVEFIRFTRERKIYLRIDEAKECQKIFYILERENILAFHLINTDIKCVDMNNVFVRCEIEELLLFGQLIKNENFIFSDSQIDPFLMPEKTNLGVINPLTSSSIRSGGNKISILLLSSDPSDASRLRIGEEFREIHEKLQLAKLGEHFSLNQRTSVRPVDISQSLLDLNPQIVHFSGHGLGDGALCFENHMGEIHPILPEALAELFEQFSDQIKCVLLNVCYSKIQAVAISQHIDYVIGMSEAVGDKAAISFAIGFYQALGAGRTTKEAYKLGCVQIRLQGIPEYLTPVLLEKNGSL